MKRRIDSPLRIVGRRSDDGHFVTLSGEPLAHLGGVLADAGQLRAVIDGVDEYAHARASGEKT